MSTAAIIRRRPRWRRYFRWGATALLALSLGTFAASLWFRVHVWYGRAGLGVDGGSFYLNYTVTAQPRSFAVTASRVRFAYALHDTWRIFMWWEPWAGGRARHMEFPLWPLAAGAGLVAAVAWWLDPPRRPRPGCCPACGYDLRGNVSGRCPECGTPRPARMRELLLRMLRLFRPSGGIAAPGVG